MNNQDGQTRTRRAMALLRYDVGNQNSSPSLLWEWEWRPDWWAIRVSGMVAGVCQSTLAVRESETPEDRASLLSLLSNQVRTLAAMAFRFALVAPDITKSGRFVRPDLAIHAEEWALWETDVLLDVRDELRNVEETAGDSMGTSLVVLSLRLSGAVSRFLGTVGHCYVRKSGPRVEGARYVCAPSHIRGRATRDAVHVAAVCVHILRALHEREALGVAIPWPPAPLQEEPEWFWTIQEANHGEQ